MILNGKKVAFLGDSITEGAGVSDTFHRYTDVFERLSGCISYNYGICGTRIAPQVHRTEENARFDRDFVSRVDEMIEDADLVVVFGGTNDFGHGDAEFGTMADREPNSFFGALHTLIVKLLNKYPHSQILFMTPLHRLSENVTVNERGIRCNKLIDYVNAIREVCEYYSIPVLDLYSVSGIQPSVDIIREIYMPDGLHPSDKGAELIAHKLNNFLKLL